MIMITFVLANTVVLALNDYSTKIDTGDKRDILWYITGGLNAAFALEMVLLAFFLFVTSSDQPNGHVDDRS
jgi:hypothetical protein